MRRPAGEQEAAVSALGGLRTAESERALGALLDRFADDELPPDAKFIRSFWWRWCAQSSSDPSA